jgi:hypothetical protein
MDDRLATSEEVGHAPPRFSLRQQCKQKRLQKLQQEGLVHKAWLEYDKILHHPLGSSLLQQS